jgi:hypothetical protein
MGAIEAIWDKPAAGLLETAFDELNAAPSLTDRRMETGLERDGRLLAAKTVAAVLAA